MRHTNINRQMSSKSVQWTVREFFDQWQTNCIRKPRIQRKKRWDDKKSKEYIKFIVRHKNSIVPFLCNEKIEESKKINYIFDGNNRSNVILDMCISPLIIYPHYIPSHFPSAIREKLKHESLQDLLSPRYTLTRFYAKCKLKYSDNSALVEICNSKIEEADENAWYKMQDDLDKLDFFNIKIQVCVFENLTDSEMRNIYESTNSTGVKLNQQELLASSTDSIRFGSSHISCFHELVTIIETSYYGEMNSNEHLKVELNQSPTLSLFEVLIALQYKLYIEYGEFINEPCNDKNDSLDAIFKLYEFLVIKDFDKPVEDGCMSIGDFVDTMIYGFNIIKSVYDSIYDTSIPIKEMKKYRTVSKNNIVLFLTFISKAKSLAYSDERITNTLLRIVLLHELAQSSDVLQSGNEEFKDVKDTLAYQAGGQAVPNKVQKILDTGAFEYEPSNEKLEMLLKYILAKSIEPSKNRKAVSRMKAIAFSAFFNQQIPSHVKRQPQNKDHIVPFSTKYKGAEPFDKCRLGNLQLIPECINKSRGTSPITNEWIRENSLQYQHYPDGETYAKICAKKQMLDIEAYNKMCEEREELYVSLIMRILD